MGAVLDRLRSVANASVPMSAQHGSPAVTVLFDLAMNKLLQFDAAAGVAHWSVFFRLFWNDERLLYNGTEEFGPGWVSSQDYISMPSYHIWKPEVVAFYSTGYELSSYGCGVYDEGFLRANGYNVFWSQPGTIQVQCDSHLEDFPFDTQECTLVVGPWVDRTFKFRSLHEGTVSNPFAGDLSSEEWAVTAVRVESLTMTYVNGLFDEVHYTLVFKRFPHFYVVSAILPMALVVVLSLLTMWLPIEEGSGERLSFAVTLFLTIMATAIFTAGYRPATREDTWLDRYQAASLSLTALPVLESVLVVWLQYIYEKVSREQVRSRRSSPPRTPRGMGTPASDASPSTSEIRRTAGLQRLKTFSSNIRSERVVADAGVALRANFRMRMIVFLMHRMPSVEWLITGRRGEEHLKPRQIDRWFRIVVSTVAVVIGAKVFRDMPISVEGGSTHILMPPVFTGVAIIGLSAFLAIGLLVFRIMMLCGERAVEQAARLQQQEQQQEEEQEQEQEQEQQLECEQYVASDDPGGITEHVDGADLAVDQEPVDEDMEVEDTESAVAGHGAGHVLCNGICESSTDPHPMKVVPIKRVPSFLSDDENLFI